MRADLQGDPLHLFPSEEAGASIVYADVREVRPAAELTLLHGQRHRPAQHCQLVLHCGRGGLLQALGGVALQRVGRDRARLPTAEVIAQASPRGACPLERPATAVLVTPAKAGFQVLQGEALRLLPDLQTKRVLAHTSPQERLGVGLLAALRRLTLSLAVHVKRNPPRPQLLTGVVRIVGQVDRPSAALTSLRHQLRSREGGHTCDRNIHTLPTNPRSTVIGWSKVTV